MKIDTRYPPQPHPVKVPLYPLKTEMLWSWRNPIDVKLSLASRISHLLSCRVNDCFLFATARTALVQFLNYIATDKGRPISVALPAFYCPHTCYEVLQAGVKVIYFDIDTHFKITKAGIDRAIQSNADVIIWPDLFVGYEDESAFEAIGPDTLVIRDLAHTFPWAYEVSKENPKFKITLFSFGSGKPLAGVGGGGFAIHDPEMSGRFAAYQGKVPPRSSGNAAPQIRSIYQTLLRHQLPEISVKLGLLPPLEHDQREMLEKAFWQVGLTQKKIPETISNREATVALKHWDRMLQVQAEHQRNQLILLNLLEEKFGTEAIQHFRTAKRLGVFAIRLPAQNRYNLARHLAEKGLQTTWYYYPLTKLSAFSPGSEMLMPGAEQLASEVLVIPFHWSHTEKGISQTAINIIKDGVVSC